jgi:signal peptidase
MRSEALRDAVVLVVVFALLLGGLYAFTGTWPPAVIVESGSMMHADSEVSYGRFGTIDPGDLVLVKNVDAVEDVGTLVEGGKERYGKPGDVIVYYAANNRDRTPIIHRAVAYVEVEGTRGSASYYVRWSEEAPCEGGATKVERDDTPWCEYGSEGIYIPSVPVQGPGSTPSNPQPYIPTRSGFLTKGDNPVTNTRIDQTSGLSLDDRGNPVPVQLGWIEGKGRAELPWLGLIKLAVAQRVNEPSAPEGWKYVCVPLVSCGHGGAYAPRDLWTMLGATLFLLVGVPLIYDSYRGLEARRAARLLPAAPRTLDAQLAPGGAVLLSWESVEGPVRSYRVYRGDERIASPSTTSFEDAAAKPDAENAYSVSAVTDHGNEGPRSALAIVRTPPAETI